MELIEKFKQLLMELEYAQAFAFAFDNNIEHEALRVCIDFIRQDDEEKVWGLPKKRIVADYDEFPFINENTEESVLSTVTVSGPSIPASNPSYHVLPLKWRYERSDEIFQIKTEWLERENAEDDVKVTHVEIPLDEENIKFMQERQEYKPEEQKPDTGRCGRKSVSYMEPAHPLLNDKNTPITIKNFIEEGCHVVKKDLDDEHDRYLVDGRPYVFDKPEEKLPPGTKVRVTERMRYYVENHGWSKDFIFNVDGIYTVLGRYNSEKCKNVKKEIGMGIYKLEKTPGGFPEDCLELVSDLKT